MAMVLLTGSAAAASVRGARSCATWITQRDLEKANQTSNSTANTWLIGYLSGLAEGMNKEFWGVSNLESLDSASGMSREVGGESDDHSLDSTFVYLWMDKYCRANPRKSTHDGALQLFNERTRTK